MGFNVSYRRKLCGFDAVESPRDSGQQGSPQPAIPSAEARPLLDAIDVSDQRIALQIGRRLRSRRRLLGLTQEQLGASVGVRFQQIQKYECAANGISAARLWKLAHELGVTTEYFFAGLEDPASNA